ncbi:MAG: hypothetical protein Q8O67_02930 [Deltaproteobacteria bacterium]|nr:hypothetical protein [Deltaproteobacteria bacterium]
MNKADLYREGARLPEQLSRILFLDGMVEGKRVLEVGAGSDSVARFLLELGASRVVCAVDDKTLLESLRHHSTLDNVDYRSIRPSSSPAGGGSGSRPPGSVGAPILPGDDGAFDLVIDFTLPQAIARGELGRLKDIGRVLSKDGFAITSLTSTTASGLSTLLDPPSKLHGPALPGYRAVVEALKGDFELVQVYFQSLLLGYLFGSFDVEPKDEGIAPQTLLMGDDPEPAGSYLFAFGNAVPVIEDVCLVQVPFDALLAAFSARRGARNFEDRTETLNSGLNVGARPRPLPPLADADTETGESTQPAAVVVLEPVLIVSPALAAEVTRLEDAVADREATILGLRAAVAELQAAQAVDPAATLAPEDADDDVDVVFAVPSARGAPTATITHAEAMVALAQSLDEATAKLLTTEAALAIVREELARAVRVRDELRADRDSLAEQSVQNDRDRAELARRVRAGDDESALLNLRAEELEETVIDAAARIAVLEAELLEVQTRAEGERQRQRVERDMLDATLSSHAEQVQELEAALSEAEADQVRSREILLARAERAERAEEETKNTHRPVDANNDAAQQRRLAEAEAIVPRLQERVAALEAALGTAEGAVRAGMESIDEVLRAADEAQRRMQIDVDAAGGRAAAAEARAAALDEERAQLAERVRSLEGDAQRLAEGVKVLVGERATLAARVSEASGEQSEKAAVLARAVDAERALEEARAELKDHETSASAEIEKLSEKRRVDQAALSELRARLQESRAAIDDVTAQRTVLQQALAAREAQLHERRADQTRLQQELDRTAAALSEQQKKSADVDAAAAALSLEVRRLNGVVEETAGTIRDLTAQRDEARARGEELTARARFASDEALAALELVESERARLQQAAADDVAALQAAFDVQKAEIERSLDERAGDTVKVAVREAVDITTQQASDLLTRMLAEADARFAAEKATLVDAGAAAVAALNDDVARVTAAAAVEIARLLEDREASHAELARVTDERARFAAEHEAARAELTRLTEATDVERAHLLIQQESAAAELALNAAERIRLHAEHEATRDELARNTESLLVVEERIADERDMHARELAALTQRKVDVEQSLAAEHLRGQALLARLNDVEVAAAAAAADLARKLDEVTGLHGEVRSDRERVVDENSHLRAQLTSAAAVNTEGAAALAAGRQRAFDEAAELNAKLQASMEEASAARRALSDSVAETDDWRARLATAMDRVTGLTARLTTQEEAVGVANGEIAALQTRLGQASVETADLGARHAAVVETIELYKGKLSQGQALLDAARTDVGELKQRLSEVSAGADDVGARFVAARAEAAAGLAEAAAALAALNEQLAAESARRSNAELDVDVLQGKLAAATTEVAEGKTRADALSSQLDEEGERRASAEADAAVFSTRLAAAAATNDAVGAELETAQKKIEALTEHVATTEVRADTAAAEVAALQERLSAAGADADATAARLVDAHTEIEALGAQLAKAQAAADDAVAEIGALQERLTVASADAESTAQRLASANETIATLTARLDGADSSLAELLEERDSAANHTAMAEDQIVGLTAKLVSAESTIGELTEALKGAHAAVDDVGRRAGDEATALQAQLDERSVDLESVKELLGERERALEDLRNRHAEVEQRTRDLDAERARLESVLETAEERARDAVDAAAALGAELVALAAGASLKSSTAEAELSVLLEDLASARAELTTARDEAKAWKAHVDDADAGLQGIRASLQRVSTERELIDGALAEARSLLGVERARGDLFHEELLEAGALLVRERARGDLFSADLSEAQVTLWRLRAQLLDVRAHGQEVQDTLDQLSASAEGDAVRGDLFSAQLGEAQEVLERERQRGGLLQAELEEAQASAGRAVARAAELSAQLDEAQETFRARHAANQTDLDRLAGATLAEQAARDAQHQHDLDSLRASLEDERAAREHADAAVVTATAAQAAAAADVTATAARLQVAEDAHAAVARRLAEAEAGVVTSTEDLGAVRQLVESLRAEITGVRESLEMARDDAREAVEVGQQAREELMLLQAERDALLERVNADAAIRDGADAQRDAAISDATAAAESARLEARRRAALEEELVRLRAEHQVALEKAKNDGAAGGAAVVDDVNGLKERLDALEKAGKAKDQKIAEQAERINRLTERIVRTEGLA